MLHNNEVFHMNEATRTEIIAAKLKQEGKDSANNSEEEDSVKDQREARQEEEGKGLINYNYLGSAECPIDTEAEEIEYSMIYRIPKIENLESCVKLNVRLLNTI